VRECAPGGVPTSLLAEFARNLANVPTPIVRQNPALDIGVEAAVRPIAYARHVSMLHGVEMDVVDMALEIGIIADRMLPIPPLLNALFAFHDLAS
jgi:hypothetical protein